MGYSTNREVLELRRSEGLLTELEAGRACRWEIPDQRDVRRVADRIREALYIASLYPEDYPVLAQAYQNYSIIRAGLKSIEARLRTSSTPKVSVLSPTPTHGPGPVGSPAPQVNLQTADQLIEAWKAHLPRNDALNFPQTVLPLEELLLLHSWAKAWQPPLMILVGQGFVTLALYDLSMDGLAWRPPQPAAKEEKAYDI